MNIPPIKSPVIAAGIGLLLMGGVHTSALADTTCRADVVFAMDNTGSMGGIIRSTTAAAKKILGKISGGDPRFKGIDAQFAVTTYWGDPVEHVGGAAGKFKHYWWCGPTATYPTRGTAAHYKTYFDRYSIYREYRCDRYTPSKTSDDSKSYCRRYYGEEACDVPLEAKLYVADASNHVVQVFGLDGGHLYDIGGTPGRTSKKKGEFSEARDVAVDKSGNVYVADRRNYRVQKFDSKGKFIRKWGSRISSYSGVCSSAIAGKFLHPHGIAVDSENNVWVSDNRIHRVQKFDNDGNFLLCFGGKIDPTPTSSVPCRWPTRASCTAAYDGKFRKPGQIAVDSSDNVYVVDGGNARIQKFDKNGNFLLKWGKRNTSCSGASRKTSGCLGTFHYPLGIAIDSDDNVYISDPFVHRIQKFTSSGTFILQWGVPHKLSDGKEGPAGGMYYPHGLSVDAADNIYVADKENQRILVFDSVGTEVMAPIGKPFSVGRGGVGDGPWCHHKGGGDCSHKYRAGKGYLRIPIGITAVGKGGDRSAEIKKVTAKAYKVNQQLTSDKEKVARAMTEWAACSSPGGCGGDWPEANLFALHQIATEGGMTDGKGYYDPTTDTTGTDTDEGYFSCGKNGKTQDPDWSTEMAGEIEAGTVPAVAPYVDPWSLDADKRKRSCDQAVGWREEAGRVVVWFGDAPSHNTTVTREEAINVLNARNIVVAGINTRSKNTGMDTCHNLRTGSFGGSCGRSGYSAVGDPTAVAEATKGTMNHNVKGDSRVIEAILKGVSAGIAQAGSQAMVSFGVNESTSAVHMYISKFDSKGWTGDLEAWALNKKTGLPDSKSWSAAAKMDKKGKKTDAYSSFKDGGAHGGFRLDWGQCKKHSACKNDFNTGPLGVSDADGESRLNWLLGDTSKDGSSLRKREGLMGDVWHSSPVYVGASGGPWWDGMAYVKKSLSFAKFQKKVEKRKPVVYVGSNGGPLHAFDAKNGKELFAYYPRSLFNSSTGAGYHHLSEPRFAHKQVYVDGTPVVNDVIIDRQWQTVLVGTLANGGRGIFALNITDPERFAVGGDRFLPYLWEFTNEDDPHFGYSQGKPTIALMNSGDWAVLVGNGPDATAVDEDGGTSQLFILKISGPGPDGVWDLGVDYRRITTGMGETKNRNGGFSPQTVDLNGDGAIDRAYMGDLYSHIWAFDLSSRDPEKWKPAYGNKPLFSGMTEDDDIHTQPITARPLVTRAPRSVTKWIAGSLSAPPPATSTSVGTGGSRSSPSPSGFASTGVLTAGKTGDGEPPTIKRATGSISKGGKLVGDGLMIYFGTGRFLSSADKTLMYKQFFYGVHDRGIPDRGTEHLVSQRFIAGGAEGGRITDPDIMVDYSKKSGWYIELPEAGERVVDRAVVRGNQIMFNTLVPDASVCASGGHGWEMSVLNHNGGSPRMASWDFDEDGVIGAGDRGVISTKAGEKKTYGYSGKKIEGKGLPSGSTIFGDRRFTPSSGADAPTETLLLPSAPLPPGRLSWIELQPRN